MLSSLEAFAALGAAKRQEKTDQKAKMANKRLII
jgi:hypothetical protein